MKLRTRTLLSVALSLVSLVAILYSVARVSMLRSFAALEADDTRQNLARATAVLADDLSTLDHTASDYAAWDDTCAFLEGKNPNLPTSEFPDAWFPRLRIDFVLIFDPLADRCLPRPMTLRQERRGKFRKVSGRILHPARC